MRRLLAILALLLLTLPAAAQPAEIKGHAHNDYEHDRPLLNALDHGFASVEADIWLRNGELLIGHDEADLDATRTLQSLYLDPLREIAASLAPPLVLLIDIKTDGEATYRALSEVLAHYADILSSVADGQVTERAARAIVSGNRPLELMTAESLRYAFYDGRLADLDGGAASTFMPLVSDNWSRQFSWTGAGDMPSSEHAKLSGIVEKAHGHGYQLRFWGTPDQAGPQRDALWQALADAGVDFVNTDDLAGFAAFRP